MSEGSIYSREPRVGVTGDYERVRHHCARCLGPALEGVAGRVTLSQAAVSLYQVQPGHDLRVPVEGARAQSRDERFQRL